MSVCNSVASKNCSSSSPDLSASSSDDEEVELVLEVDEDDEVSDEEDDEVKDGGEAALVLLFRVRFCSLLDLLTGRRSTVFPIFTAKVTSLMELSLSTMKQFDCFKGKEIVRQF